MVCVEIEIFCLRNIVENYENYIYLFCFIKDVVFWFGFSDIGYMVEIGKCRVGYYKVLLENLCVEVVMNMDKFCIQGNVF